MEIVNKNKFKSRKFILTSGIILLSSVFLSLGKLSGGEWITAVTIASGVYGAENVFNKKVQGG